MGRPLRIPNTESTKKPGAQALGARVASGENAPHVGAHFHVRVAPLPVAAGVAGFTAVAARLIARMRASGGSTLLGIARIGTV